MPLIKRIYTENGLLILWELTESLDSLSKLIPSETHNPIFLKRTNPKRKKEWLAVCLLLREINCLPSQITYLETGKPKIEHPIYKEISISHSSRIVGIFLHKSSKIGLDIESIERDYLSIEKKYLSEIEMLLARKKPNGHALFWCIKEAAYKAATISGIHFAKQIKISYKDEKASVSLIASKTQTYQVSYIEIEKQIIVFLIEEKEINS